jgi:hypothetical protein
MSITAVVLSAGDYSRRWPGLEVLVHRSTIRSSEDLQRARFEAVLRVATPHFFFLDDDDELPAGHLEVLERCRAAGAALAYTDERIIDQDGTATVVTRNPYVRAEHLQRPLDIHHLVLCSTAAAQRSVQRLPRGHYAPEVMLYWDLARDGAVYVPGVAYEWHRKRSGMHRWPATARSQMRAALWAKTSP